MDHTVAISGTEGGGHGVRGKALLVAFAGLLAWSGLTAGAILTNRDGAGGGSSSPGMAATARVAGGAITLAGAVPGEQARQAIVDAATIAFGAGNVVDRMTVVPGADVPAWTRGFPALVLTLRPLASARASASDDGVVVSGVAAEPADRDRAVSTAKVIAGGGGTVVDDIVVRTSNDGGASGAEVRRLGTAVGAILRNSPVQFAGSGTALSARGKAALDRVALVLKGARGVKVEVAGHTDARGGAAANREASARRAAAVVAYLKRRGVSGSILTARGYGETKPLRPNTTAAGRAENRRIEISVGKG